MGFDVKNTTKFSLLDLVFPFTCRGCGRLGSLLCGRCKKYNIEAMPEICPRCRKNLKKCRCEAPVVACAYRDGVMVQLVEDFKYKSVRKTAEVLAELLTVAVGGRDGDRGGDGSGDGDGNVMKRNDIVRRDGIVRADESVAIVPLPTIAKHVRERGFDHTLLIARKMARKWPEAKVCRVLERRGQTVQVGADKEVRKRQAIEAYAVSERGAVEINELVRRCPEQQFLLIDDVWTTGASMEAAIRVMREAGAQKIAAAVVLMPRG